MKQSISILIPVYNSDVTTLVTRLKTMADSMEGLDYEIICIDDGSTDTNIKTSNKKLNGDCNIKIIELEKNVGRASVRNTLAREARMEWCLFIDSDVKIIQDDYLVRYINAMNSAEVVYGGVFFTGDETSLAHNLRYLHEIRVQPRHTAEMRSKSPYSCFCTPNFLIKKETMQTLSFDESIKTYGYEDLLFGKLLKNNSVTISHIDNPVTIDSYDSNTQYINKIEESISTLVAHQDKIGSFSALLRFYRKLERYHIAWLPRMASYIALPVIRRNLTSDNPCLTLLNIYKIMKLARFL